jgi:hypothetical protein
MNKNRFIEDEDEGISVTPPKKPGRAKPAGKGAKALLARIRRNIKARGASEKK